MAGEYNGAQAVIRKTNAFATYLPCSTHSLNLAGVHATETSSLLKNYFGNVQKLNTFFSSSPGRWKILKTEAQISLHSISKTRWSARLDAIRPLAKKPKEIVLALNTVKNQLDLPSELYNDVLALIKWMKSFEFVVNTTFWITSITSN